MSGNMKSMLIKHIFIKIKANYKRFLSLLSMALLGVGFYSGIQACSPDMLKTLDNFYDFILQTTDHNIFNTEIKNAHPLFRTDLFGIHRCTIGNILGNAHTESESRDRLWCTEGTMADRDCDPRRYFQL